MKLSETTAALLRSAVSMVGSYNPDEVMPIIEEQLTPRQVETVQRFLTWCCATKTTFGRNVHEVFANYAAQI